ncbi:MAG TPA: alpha/beta hydrolase, partial [Bryobacterales bacterium]|nr:alpha/beta hydrolase [Bryobacterales bacterium]
YLLRSIEKVALEFGAVMAMDEPLSAYANLPVPVLLTAGTTGPLPARRVAEVLGRAFGEASLRVIPGAGHMAPITQPDTVNPHIIAHLAAHPIC